MANNLSHYVQFDEMRRCMRRLMDCKIEEEFLKVIRLQETSRLECIALKQECERLRQDLNASFKSIADLETKLFNARRLLDAESRARKAAESERDELEYKMMAAADLLQQEKNLRNETKDKLKVLLMLPRKKETMSCIGEDTNNDNSDQMNSTGSILSELSITESEDDFLNDSSGAGSTKRRKKRRPTQDILNVSSKRKGSSVSMKSYRGITAKKEQKQRQLQQQQQPFKTLKRTVQKLCASTIVTIAQGGNAPIRSGSTYERTPTEKRI